jgi:4-amino-4-deoxy-L-arabinose transferase-like glycosyltransferase
MKFVYNAPMVFRPASLSPELEQPRSKLPAIWLLIGLAVIFVWRILFSGWANLIPDECSYWTWSRSLDWSYFDNSGMVAYLIRLSTAVLGKSTPFSVRLPFLILSVLTTFLVYRVTVILFGSRLRGLVAALFMNLAPLALLGGSAAIHDNAQIFFWMLALWGAAKYLKSDNLGWFYVIGTATGLAIQSKYTGVLLLSALLFFFLWSRDHRRLLLRKEPWIGVLIAFCFALPILWWNYRHEWASLHHILFIGSGSTSSCKRIAGGFGYHLAQFFLVSPLFYAGLLYAWLGCLTRLVLKFRPEYALLSCFGLPLIVFGIMAFEGHVEANWGFMGYPAIVILAVETILSGRRDPQRSHQWRFFNRRFVKWGLILAVGPAALLVLHSWIGLLPAGLEKRLGKSDRVIWETTGWKGLGDHVDKLRKKGDVIAGDSYQMTAVLEFNIPGQPRVRYLAPWRRPTQFDVWEPSFENLRGRTILYVSSRPLKPSSSVRSTIYDNFAKVEALQPYDVMYHGTPIRRAYLYSDY